MHSTHLFALFSISSIYHPSHICILATVSKYILHFQIPFIQTFVISYIFIRWFTLDVGCKYYLNISSFSLCDFTCIIIIIPYITYTVYWIEWLTIWVICVKILYLFYVHPDLSILNSCFLIHMYSTAHTHTNTQKFNLHKWQKCVVVVCSVLASAFCVAVSVWDVYDE